MKHSFLFFTSILFYQLGSTQHKPAYQIVDIDNQHVNYSLLLEEARQSDVILFGEMHDNPICHWLEMELMIDLDSLENLVLGLEMIERDNNKSLQRYLTDDLTYEQLDSVARLWNNYKTDYKQMVDFAKENSISVVGTNVPRRFAGAVYKDGFEALENLTEEEREWLPTIPIDYDENLPGYKDIFSMFDDPSHVNDNLPKAQAIKDATMAHFIATSIDSTQQMLHINGSYHSENFEGIVWYLNKYAPELKILTIASREQSQLSVVEEENLALANFTILVIDKMTKSY